MAGNETNWIFLLLPVLFIGVGGLFLFIGVRQFKNAGLQSKWSSVSGTVTGADPGIGFRSYDDRRGVHLSGGSISINTSGKKDGCFPQVAYEYVVGNMRYTSQRLGNLSPSGVSETQANRIVAEYPAGKTVAVFYDPANPQNAVLIPQKAGCGAVFTVVIGGLVLAVGLLFAAGAAYVALHTTP